MDAQLIDDDGYLVNPLDWDESWAEYFAGKENIQLTSDHWNVIRFMRSYYETHLIAPDARYSIKHLSEKFGSGARNKLFELFPYGYVQQACRIAGMKRPRNWSTG
jgi:tRNA 2-thiouridine synthesizing protein E